MPGVAAEIKVRALSRRRNTAHAADQRCRLYLITPPSFETGAFAATLEKTLDAGDVAAVQLRLKDMDDDHVQETCQALRPLVQDRGVAFILNDRPDLAAELGCDGVHIGQKDSPYAEARRLLGPDAIVGVTCHNSLDLAFTAADLGADYVAFGAFFPTQTKQPDAQADIGTVRWWCMFMTVPCVAIGGITVDNCVPLIDAGADFLAVSSGVWGFSDGPAAAVRRFDEIMTRATR
ncbi:MAG: thiamine phosphate synthase [Hyphomicrobiales bacterium]|nr:thiamine phosphate synthase [Hyphomicrobiales bacterium]